VSGALGSVVERLVSPPPGVLHPTVPAGLE
jgi:hypothetical protein